MGAPIPDTPVVFLKPPTALLPGGANIVIPTFSHEMHHEVEMVVLLNSGGRDIPVSSAREYIAGVGVGLDMTLRDVQAEAKSKGLPWAVAKGFDTSAPVSRIVPWNSVPDVTSLRISLSVNGSVRQLGSTADMIFSVEQIIAYLSSVFTLRAGDLIFTGTPEGVGPVVPGDRLHAELGDVASLDVGVASASGG
jgi:5-carboxymethyl-2-hydroxymuconate isomerase